MDSASSQTHPGPIRHLRPRSCDRFDLTSRPSNNIAARSGSKSRQSNRIVENTRSEAVFRINDFPIELREKIFAHELHNAGRVPNLLIALAAEKESGSYKAAQNLYRRIAYRVTSNNMAAFSKIRLFNLMQLHHLTIVSPIRLDAQKIFLINNLQTLTIDESQYDDSNIDRINLKSPRILASYIMKASNCIEKLIFRFKTPRDSHHPRKIPLFLRELKEDMRAAPREEPSKDDGTILYIWEAECGNHLVSYYGHKNSTTGLSKEVVDAFAALFRVGN